MKYGLLFTLMLAVLFGVFFLPNIISYIQHPIKIDFNPQKTRVYTIDGKNDTVIDVMATILPQFAMSLKDGKFANIWTAQAAERKQIVKGEVLTATGNKMPVAASFDTKTQKMTLTPMYANSVKPGMYQLSIKVKTVKGEVNTFTQDFTWGVLAINTNKGIYQVGEKASIGMAVLDSEGKTKCKIKNTMVLNTARVWLTVTSPSGKEQKFSTDENTIQGSKDCVDRKVTNLPDFETEMSLDEPGKYQIHMVAETYKGKSSTDDFFVVGNEAPKFDIERVKYPTRIYPRADYPVQIKVKANENYKGTVQDFLPGELRPFDPSNEGKVVNDHDYKVVTWNVDWKAGETYTLSYVVHFPPIVPEFYLIGPLHIGDFHEGRGWQVASDAIFSLVQEVHGTINTAVSSVTASFSAGVTQNNLLVMNCYRTNASSWGTITNWTRAIRNTGSTPRTAQYYRVVNVATAGTFSFSCTSTSTGGEKAIQLMEFSGNSTTGVVDSAAAGVRTGRTCNTNTTSNAMTPNNPDDLIVSLSATTTTNRTVVSHKTLGGLSIGIDDADINGANDGFLGAAGSYTSGYGEAINNPPINTTDTVTWNGSGTCVVGLVAYNATISISQGSFRFYDNQNSSTPSAALAAQNTNITLATPNYPFRMRILLDVDAPSGSLGLGSGDFILQYAELPSTNNCLDGAYTPVATDSAVAYSPNENLDNLIPISSMAAGLDPDDASGGYSTKLENYMELYTDDDPGNDISNNQNGLGNNQAGLWDFSLIDNSNAGTHTYCLILTDPAGGLLDAYRNIPRVSTRHVEVLFRGGSTIKGGTTVL